MNIIGSFVARVPALRAAATARGGGGGIGIYSPPLSFTLVHALSAYNKAVLSAAEALHGKLNYSKGSNKGGENGRAGGGCGSAGEREGKRMGRRYNNVEGEAERIRLA